MTGEQGSLCWHPSFRCALLCGAYDKLPLKSAETTAIAPTLRAAMARMFPEGLLICIALLHEKTSLHSSSHCALTLVPPWQMRGSIPLYWVQDTASVSPINPKPAIQLQQYDPHYSATRLHFQARPVTHQFKYPLE